MALAFAIVAGTVNAAPRPPVTWSMPPQQIVVPPPPVDLTPHDMPSKADYAAGTRPDQIGRIIVNVMVNRQGPFRFALDTGANRSVLTPHLVTVLGLHTDDGDAVTMNGVTGSAAVPTTLVERVAAGDLALERQRLPVADSLTSEIDGILGVDGLSAKRVLVDFAKDRIEIRNSRYERPMAGVTRIPAQLRFGRLMVVNAYVNGVHAKAVIDTGSEYTLGNDALRAALFATADLRQKGKIEVIGETLDKQQGERRPVSLIKVGDVRATHFDVVFGGFYVFKLWNLDAQPALVIGMDIIGNLDAMVIDYERCEVQLVARQAPELAVRHWGDRESWKNL
ncbi:MAG TPA: aspartyl protease family protein [Steroidobacteraceae bacterium]|jgi:hypothetical protein|nr:aspartyl protease family protein [Steroidobacteraceae bacterium]